VDEYRRVWGTAPIYHQGQGGVKTAIDREMTAAGLDPYGNNFDVADLVRQDMIERLKKIYTVEFPELNAWPAVRDWLRGRVPGNVIIPN